MSRLGGWLGLIGGLMFLVPSSGRSDAPAQEPKPESGVKAPALDSHGDPLPHGARARLGSVRFRHGGQVQSLRCLPDGKTLLSYGNDQSLRYWDAETGKEIRHTRLGFDPNNTRFVQAFGRGGANFSPYQDNQPGYCLSADAKTLIAPEGNNVLKVKDLQNGTVTREIKIETGNFRFITLSPDNKTVAGSVFEQDPNTGVQTGRIRLWDIATGKELPELVGPMPKQEGQLRFIPQYFVFSPDGKSVAAVGQEFNGRNGIIRVWQLGKEKEPIRLLEHGGTNGTLVFSPDGRLLAEVSANPVTGSNMHLRLWDTFTGKEIQELGENSNGSSILFFSPDGKMLMDVDQNNQTLHVWDPANGKELASLSGQNGIVAVVFSPDGKKVAIGSNDQQIHLHEIASGKELFTFKGYSGNMAVQMPIGGIQGLGSPIAFSADGKTLFATSSNMIRRWDTNTGKEIQIGDNGPDGGISALAFTANGKELITAGEGGLRTWDPIGLRRLRAPDGPTDDEGEPLNAVSLCLAPDGKSVAIGWADGQITLCDTATGKELRKFQGGHDSGINSMVFAHNGKTLLSSCYEGRINWWDASNGKLIRQIAGRPHGDDGQPGILENRLEAYTGPTALALTADGASLLGAGTDNGIPKVRFWELATGKLRRTLQLENLTGEPTDLANLQAESINPGVLAGFISHLAVTPDGKNLAIGANGNIELRDLRRGREVRQFALNGTLQGLRFSPDGKYLAGGGDDGTLRLWETATGTVKAEMRGHRGSVTALTFSPDGKSLASAGNDCNVLFWDVAACMETDTKPAKLTDKELAELWQDLAGEDAEKGFRAVQRLADAPDQALPLLRERVKPVPVLNKQQLSKLVDDLEHDRFDQRKRAFAELEKLAELAEPALRQRLADNPSLDLKQRIEKLLEQQAGPSAVPELVRQMRSVEVLQEIDAPEARQLLEKIGQGAPGSRVTEAAKAALSRLSRRE